LKHFPDFNNFDEVTQSLIEYHTIVDLQIEFIQLALLSSGVIKEEQRISFLRQLEELVLGDRSTEYLGYRKGINDLINKVKTLGKLINHG